MPSNSTSRGAKPRTFRDADHLLLIPWWEMVMAFQVSMDFFKLLQVALNLTRQWLLFLSCWMGFLVEELLNGYEKLLENAF